MEVEIDEEELKIAGGEILSDGRRGLRIHGWEIESFKRSILTSLEHRVYCFLTFLFFQSSFQLNYFVGR